MREKLLAKFRKKNKVVKKKVKRSDLQENIKALQESEKAILNEIKDLSTRMSELDFNSEEDREEHSRLAAVMNEKNTMYSAIQKELEQEYKTLKTMNESGKTETVLKCVMVAGEFVLCAVTFMVNRENPTVMKTVEFIMKHLRPKMTL